MVAVVGMGVLIVAGVVVLGVALVGRMSGVSTIPGVVMDEPAGTRVAGVSLAPDRMAVQLTGGGPDRVVLVDTKGGRVLGRVGLAR